MELAPAFGFGGLAGAGLLGGAGGDPAAIALFARMTNQPTSARKAVINNAIVSLKGYGIWSKLDTFYALAAADAQSASLNWVADSYNLTAANSPTFTADQGYTGNGTTSRLDSGFDQASAVSPNFTQNNSSLFARSNTNVRTDSASIIGTFGGVCANINPWNASVNNVSTALFAAVNTNAGVPTSAKGLFTVSRQSSTTYSVYQDATSLVSLSVTSGTIVTGRNFWLLAANPTVFSTNQISIGGWGSGLSATDVANLSAVITTYLTALGVS